MKKVIYLLALTAVTGGTIAACKKNTVRPSGKQTSFNQLKSTSSDTYLRSVLADNSLGPYEKANIFLNEDLLSETICRELIASPAFDAYIIEVVLASQTELSDNVLIDLVRKTSISDATVRSILQSKSPLSGAVKSQLASTRPGISLSDIAKYDERTKLISLCQQGIIYTKRVISSRTANGWSMMLEDAETVHFANHASSANVGIMAAGCGGKWKCGDETTKDIGDGITIVTCLVSDRKCVKLAKKDASQLSGNDASVVSVLDNASLSAFQKGNAVLNVADFSDALLGEILDRRVDLHPFVFETIMVSAGEISDDNLCRLIIDETLPDPLLKNILIVNTPLSADVKSLVSKFHPDISLTSIAAYDEKDIAVSVCARSLICGDEITLTEVSDTTHELTAKNKIMVAFSATASDSEVAQLVAGCGGRWICGVLSLITESGGLTRYTCVSPPEEKCVKLARKVSSTQ